MGRNTVDAVLKETLRLFTSAPLVARTSVNEPLVIPSTTHLYLPPKTQIMMASLLTHKRQDLWGPDAEAFRPERWFDTALLDKITSTPFMYSPFYGGPRAVGAQCHLQKLYLTNSHVSNHVTFHTVSGTGILVEPSGLLYCSPHATVPGVPLRARVYARGFAATRSLGGHARPPGRREDPPGDQLYHA